MKHCILAKYRAEVYPRREVLLPRIREIFAPLTDLPASTVSASTPTAWRGTTGTMC